MCVVKPVDLVDKLGSLGTERDRSDVQVFEALVLGVNDQVLGLEGHELRVQPGSEELAVVGLEPLEVFHAVSFLKGHN